MMRTPAAMALLVCAACGSISPFDQPASQISTSPDGAFNARQLSAAEADAFLARHVTLVTPVLFPSYLSEGAKTCTAFGARDTFTLQCFGGAVIVELATQTERPADYKPKVLRKQKFRADPAATFMDADPADAAAVRMMLWVEPGSSADKVCHCVHYDLHTNGITEVEFLKIANALQVAKSGS